MVAACLIIKVYSMIFTGGGRYGDVEELTIVAVSDCKHSNQDANYVRLPGSLGPRVQIGLGSKDLRRKSRRVVKRKGGCCPF